MRKRIKSLFFILPAVPLYAQRVEQNSGTLGNLNGAYGIAMVARSAETILKTVKIYPDPPSQAAIAFNKMEAPIGMADYTGKKGHSGSFLAESRTAVNLILFQLGFIPL